MEALKNYFAQTFTTPRQTAGQIVGFVMVAISLLIYSFRKRQHVLAGKLVHDLITFAHYALLEAYSGALIALICVFREIIFYQKGKWKFVSHIGVLFAIGGVMVLASVWTWVGILSLLPLIGSLLAVVGYWCTKPLRLRLITAAAILFYLVYNVFVLSPPGILANVFSLISLGIGIRKDLHPVPAEPPQEQQ